MLTGGSARPKKIFAIAFTFTIYIVVLPFFRTVICALKFSNSWQP